MNKKDGREGAISQFAGMDDDIYFWSKNSRPSAEKDHCRNAIASLCLSHLKTRGTVLKSVHVPESLHNGPSFRRPENDDLSPFLMYSLNKKRRWEAEEQLGVESLGRVSEYNHGWNVLLLERVSLKIYLWPWPDCAYGSSPERYMDYYMIRCVHKLNEENGGYERNELTSPFGQRYSHFIKKNRQPQKEDGKEEEPSEPVAAYNFLRAPKNAVTLLQKQYQSSNWGWEWPHGAYWRRIDRLKDHNLELRYGELEDLDAEVDEDNEQEEGLGNGPSKFYNLEDHFVDDNFVMVKNKKNKKKASS